MITKSVNRGFALIVLAIGTLNLVFVHPVPVILSV